LANKLNSFGLVDPSAKIIEKYFVLTSLGIMILQQNSQKIFYLTDFFIETTVGRIIFTTNLKNYFEKRI
jgi:hypothetical protein